ncbi:hypothetical protein [Undibacterium sp. YM2]|uniref:hypothetical protein n=1 Tax=Undibacterium sp. YM2 TaxID=2058625 RepID=UPI00138A58B3|nr:hypothetical protein [Undibacterium sp. YM2]
MVYFWILVVVLLCLVVYAFDQQSELDPEATRPQKLFARIVVWCLRSLRQLGRNIVHGFKTDVTGWRSGASLKKQTQQNPEQKD